MGSRHGWGTSRRREELPPDWERRRRERERIAGGRCEYVSRSGVRCKRPGTDADHAFDRENHSVSALRWLCEEHHKRKTARESRAARLAKRRKGGREKGEDGPGVL